MCSVWLLGPVLPRLLLIETLRLHVFADLVVVHGELHALAEARMHDRLVVELAERETSRVI